MSNREQLKEDLRRTEQPRGGVDEEQETGREKNEDTDNKYSADEGITKCEQLT